MLLEAERPLLDCRLAYMLAAVGLSCMLSGSATLRASLGMSRRAARCPCLPTASASRLTSAAPPRLWIPVRKDVLETCAHCVGHDYCAMLLPAFLIKNGRHDVSMCAHASLLSTASASTEWTAKVLHVRVQHAPRRLWRSTTRWRTCSAAGWTTPWSAAPLRCSGQPPQWPLTSCSAQPGSQTCIWQLALQSFNHSHRPHQMTVPAACAMTNDTTRPIGVPKLAPLHSHPYSTFMPTSGSMSSGREH